MCICMWYASACNMHMHIVIDRSKMCICMVYAWYTACEYIVYSCRLCTAVDYVLACRVHSLQLLLIHSMEVYRCCNGGIQML